MRKKKAKSALHIKEGTIEYTRWRHPGGKLRRLGPSHCTEKELLAIILHSGTKGLNAEQIAQELIDRYGTVYDIAGKTLSELMGIKGIGAVRATQIAAIFELTKRIIRHIESR